MGVVFNGGIRDVFRGHAVPPIHDICKTVDMLVGSNTSFSRFGDGEFKMMTEGGVHHSFQRSNPRLSERLSEILSSNEDGVEIGINRIYFYQDGFDHPRISDFIYRRGYGMTMLRHGYLELLHGRDHYYDSVFSIPAHHYMLDKEFLDAYYERVKDIWRGRNVVLVTGDTEIMGYDRNIFAESARSVRLVEISKIDAFEYHGRIMKYISSLGLSKKDDVLALVCGLEATVLAYDLAESGYRAIDAGHIAKEYYNYSHGIVPYSASDRGFF